MIDNEISAPKDDNLQAHNSEVVNSRFSDATDESEPEDEAGKEIAEPVGKRPKPEPGSTEGEQG